ncbi:MAG: hypothetical protein JWO07_350 [Candidatus Saccharibacteria bacterium]|nr:hypothetical protein [Candidatus Saccharibacteria bacterium]
MRQRTQKASEEAYFKAVEQTQQKMDQAGIDFRIIGSLATNALIAATGGDSEPMKFHRSYAVDPEQALPDIDVIVPRADLKRARAIREEMARAEVPVGIGLAASSSEIDFRPDEEQSYLTHGGEMIPVSNSILEAQEVPFHGADVRTLPIDTQLHTYGTFGGTVRVKDMPAIRQLIALRGKHASDKDFKPFHEFMRIRRTDEKPTQRAIRMANYVIDKSPTLVGNTIRSVGKKVASRKGLR